jgi:hypothetical protein
MNKPHVHREIIHAWADGADIQYLRLDGVWDDIPPLNESNEYRIKPRTVKREGWVAMYTQADGFSYVQRNICDSEDDVKQICPNAKAIIKIEWEEEE